MNPTYAWFKNNETTPLSTGVLTDSINAVLTLNNAVNGTKIYCKITASSDLCTETPVVTSDTFRITCITSKIEDLTIIKSYDIYPNPSKGEFEIKLSLVKSEKVQLSFLNTLGQVIKMDKVETNEFVGKYDFSHCPNGFYFVKLTIDGQNIVKRINISR